MAETFREREMQRRPQAQLPAIRREEREPHTVLDALGRSADHLRTPAEMTRPGGAEAVYRAGMRMRIARNVSDMRLEGSTPISERFMRLLDAIRL